MLFFLGTHKTGWLDHAPFPLFVSHRQLRQRKRLPVAACDWALDSGGFTALSTHGRWDEGPVRYADSVRRYQDEIGRLQWAAPQDWMCEPAVRELTGMSVEEHQQRTVENVLRLRQVASDIPFVPVLQGWDLADYPRHVEMYDRAGLDLTTEPVVGVGSVCRRQATSEIAALTADLAGHGIRLHGFGVKTSGLSLYGEHLTSADSMAWSFAARYEPRAPGCISHRACNNCIRFATRWREKVLARLP